MRLSFTAITATLLIATVTGCGGSSETSRDDAIAALLVSATEEGFNNENFVACVADNVYEFLGTESWSDVVDAMENDSLSDEEAGTISLECIGTMTDEEVRELMEQ
ncbi:MAG: hypothetical protein CL447_05695 [Acidimicrobiaceae bacterium]|nr:hypothetical protein [Acidimicrobiaceae bacterium]|tara:strand:- start:225 stop:542 length:318 start_codon:yes stop_codon:yes gene_type:complete